MSTETNTGSATAERRTLRPFADIVEFEDRYQIMVDLPGVTEDGLDVTIERNILTVRGSHSGHEPEGMQSLWREYEPADYERRFTLGNGIDREQVEAELKHGVLTLVLPKAENLQPQRIAVRNGE